jgi:hypothetical protein
VGAVDGAPAGLCGLDELERHRDSGGPRAGSLGDPLPQPDGGEGRLDRVSGTQVDPVLGRVVVEREEHASAPSPTASTGAVIPRRRQDRIRLSVGLDGCGFRGVSAQDKVCLLVMIGVRDDGTKELAPE